MAVFASESRASNVLIRNVTIEKYASVAQKGDQYLLAQREARASEARSGTRRGDCETATTKRVKRPKRYPTEARSRTIMQKADAFRRDVCYGIFRQSGIRFAVGKCSIWVWVI